MAASNSDRICGIVLTLDPAAVTEPDLFAQCVRDSFAEIIDIGPRRSDAQ